MFHSSCIFTGKAVCTCELGSEQQVPIPYNELQKILEQKTIQETTIVAIEVPALLKRKKESLEPIINNDLPPLQSIQKTVERATTKLENAITEKQKLEIETIETIKQINNSLNKAQDDYQELHQKRMKVGYGLAEVEKQINQISHTEDTNQFKVKQKNTKQLLQKRDLLGNLINKNVLVKWEEDERWWKAIVIDYDQSTGEALLYYPQTTDEEKINLKDLVYQQSIAWDVKVQKPQYIK